MMRTRSFPAAIAFAAVAVLGGCRQVAVESDPGLVYAVEVYNPMPHAMVVSYEDAGGEHPLGTVAAGSRERFVVAGAASPAVSIVGRDQGGTHLVRKQVTLQAGSTVQVSLAR